jgi:hypothetical protein
MEIAPVGVQMSYANAANVSNVQHNLNHEAALQQSFENMRQEKDAELKQTQVRNKNDAEGGTIKDDPERRSRGGGYYYHSSKRQQPEEEEPDNLSVDYRKGRLLDISL